MLRYESNYINAFRPSTRVVRDYRFVERSLGGIGLVGLVVPVDEEIDAEAIGRIRDLDRAVLAVEAPRGARGSTYVTSLATVLDPDGRLAGLDPRSVGPGCWRPSST